VTSPDFEARLQSIRAAYGQQCQTMIEAIQQYLPADVNCTHPDGGMFLWLTLPSGTSATDLFQIAIEKGVAFVPGQAFHASGGGENTMRLKFSNCDPPRIVEGIRRLASALGRM
jgi:2-aminoadipate transaminase